MVAVLCTATTVHAQLPWGVDTNFRTTITDRNVADMHFLDNGQMLVTGNMAFPDEPWYRFGVAKLNADGSRDPTFITIGAEAGTIIPWDDQYYIQGGQYFRRFNGDGTVDPDWNYTSPFLSSWNGGGLYVYPDGSVLTTGNIVLKSYVDTTIMGYGYCLVKLNPIGLPDSTFTHRQCLDGYVENIDPLPDGKFLLSGMQDIYDGQNVGHILQVWSDGSIDTSFHTTIFYGKAADYYFYSDGRILAAGSFQVPEYPGDTLQLLRLLPDGTVDTTFNNTIDIRAPDEYFPSGRAASDIFELEPGILLVTGDFTHVEGDEVGGIVAIDTAGNVLHDQYFTGTGCGSVDVTPNGSSVRAIRAIERGPDGSLYLHGGFSGFDDGHGFHPDLPFIVKLHAQDVGMEELESRDFQIKVFPNPGTDRLQIETGAKELKNVQLLDDMGRAILTASFSNARLDLITKNLAPGVYLIEVHTAEGRRTVKWTKR